MAKRYMHLYFEDNEENRSEFGPLCKKVDKGWSMFVDYQRNGRGRRIRAKVISVSPPWPESGDPLARQWLIHYDLGKGGAGWPLQVEVES